MALPYYMPPVAPQSMQPNTRYYGSPPPPMQLMHLIQLQQDLHKMSYQPAMQNVYYAAPAGYQYNMPPRAYPQSYSPVLPTMAVPQAAIPYQGARMPFVPVSPIMYSNVPVAAPLPPQQEYQPEQTYLSQLKSAADRAAEADIKAAVQPEQPAWKPYIPTPDKLVPEPEPDSTAVVEANTSETVVSHESSGQTYFFDVESQPAPGNNYISRIISEEEDEPIRRRDRKPILRTRSGTPVIDDSDETSIRRVPSPIGSYLYWFPRPVTSTCEHVYIGANGTCVPTSFYATIPWQHPEESTRMLMEFIFNDGSLVTHSMDGENRLDPKIVNDIITHISYKSSVTEDYVKSTVIKLCKDTARQFHGYV